MEHIVTYSSSSENDLPEELNTTSPKKVIDPMFDLSNPKIETPLTPNDHVPINSHQQDEKARDEFVCDPTMGMFEDIVLPSDEEMKEIMMLLEDEVVDVVANPLESSEGENDQPPSHDCGDHATSAKADDEKSTGGKQPRTSWTTEEHRMFLLGMRVHGKSKWRIISRDFIPTKSAIQIASHAQKYFNRQKLPPKGKKRPSIHDIRNINPLMPARCWDNINMMMPNQHYWSNTTGVDASESKVNPTATSYNFRTAVGNQGASSTSFGPIFNWTI